MCNAQSLSFVALVFNPQSDMMIICRFFLSNMTISPLLGAWCMSLAGPIVAQLGVFFSPDYLSHKPFSLYHDNVFYLFVSL